MMTTIQFKKGETIMGLLDMFRKNKEIQKAESEPEQTETYGFKPGDKITQGPFQFTFIKRDITEYWGPHDDYTRVVGQEIGWAVECMDKTTPMKDVVMPDMVEGYPVIDAKECFRGCYNIASVSHISTEVVKSGHVGDMFKNSGLREVPEQLTGYHISTACAQAYAIPNIETIIINSGFYCEPNVSEKQRAETAIANFEQYKERDTLLIEDGFSPYEKFETVSFVYDFHPISVVRAQDLDGKWFAVNPNGPRVSTGFGYYGDTSDTKTVMIPYDSYMKQFKSDKIQGLTVDSFVEISCLEGKKAIESAYDTAIQKQKVRAESAQEKFDAKVAEAIESANKAQEGLDFVPRKVEPQVEETTNDTKAITENEDRDEL